VWWVGILDPGIPHLFAAFREAMQGLGYVEGRNIKFEMPPGSPCLTMLRPLKLM
jgi:hypothetical protein